MWTEQKWQHISELEDGVHRIDYSVSLKAFQLQSSKKILRKEHVDGAQTLSVYKKLAELRLHPLEHHLWPAQNYRKPLKIFLKSDLNCK